MTQPAIAVGRSEDWSRVGSRFLEPLPARQIGSRGRVRMLFRVLNGSWFINALGFPSGGERYGERSPTRLMGPSFNVLTP